MRLIEEINGKSYSVRPNGETGKCPYCGRIRKSPKDSRAIGFAKSGFSNHVFTCFEKRLKESGYIEMAYDMEMLRFPVKRI